MSKRQSGVPLTLTTPGERIAQARRVLGVTFLRDVTREDLAEMVGVSAATVSRWEADLRVPREATLAKLAKVLGVTPSYLRYGEGEGLRLHDATAAAANAGRARTGRTKGK